MADTERCFRFGLVGWPLDFSLSPLIHKEFFRSTGLSGEYTAYPLPPDRFGETVSELLGSGIAGLNVTYPYKSMAARMCDELEGCSQDLLLINTMKATDGHLAGYNTDIYGFSRFIDECGLPEPFFVTGSGGAARAVDYVLHERNLRYELFCRDPSKWIGFASAEKLDELSDSLVSNDTGTVVNATTLGWKDGDVFPLEEQLLEKMVFADLNYNGSWYWRNNLQLHGVKIFTGETMLVHQAAKSFEIWTGIMPEIAEVLEIVRERLEEMKKGCDCS